MRFYRPTWAEVNLGNLAHNFRQVKKRLAKGTKILATVKADAYGHGLIPVAKKLVSCQADYLGVASIDEGITLRKENIRTPILVLGAALKEDVSPFFEYNLTPTVCSLEFALALHYRAGELGKIKNIHIKVDTGMGRLGVLENDAFGFVKQIQRLNNLRIEGIFTHFPVADTNRNFTARQIRAFSQLIERLKQEGIRIPLAHAANSMGIIGYKNSQFTMVRPGLMLYGLSPKKNLKVPLKPVLSLKTKVVYFKQVPKRYGISYGRTYITKRETTIATLPIGYGDGYPRILSNKAPVLLKGERFKISGRVCMDQIMVDVRDVPMALGDEAVLIGAQGKQRISAEELAILSLSIPYEIVCGLGSRIPRVYIE